METYEKYNYIYNFIMSYYKYLFEQNYITEYESSDSEDNNSDEEFIDDLTIDDN